mmetsp:Transcript_6657/g.15666  ORF Transcript_6657/g.15666 Transcript_6657/m.15666 type:complete len:329 (+) Transcript_6657:186-1172(+)
MRFAVALLVDVDPLGTRAREGAGEAAVQGLLCIVGPDRRVGHHHIVQPAVAQHVGQPQPLRGVHGEHAVDQLDRGGREVRVALPVPAVDRVRGRVPLALRLQQGCEARVLVGALLEREEAGEHSEKADAERPHVSLEAVVADPHAHLGRAVGRATTDVHEWRAPVHRACRSLGVDVREAEVDDLDLAPPHLGQQHILELQVAVGHALRVEVLDAREELPHKALRHHLDQRVGREDLIEELAAARTLHEYEVEMRRVRGARAVPEHLNHVRMVEAREDGALGAAPLDGVGTAHHLRVDHLDRCRAGTRQLSRGKRDTVRPLAELAGLIK